MPCVRYTVFRTVTKFQRASDKTTESVSHLISVSNKNRWCLHPRSITAHAVTVYGHRGVTRYMKPRLKTCDEIKSA
uniref:Uncharacterized protein n=1 Tax=Anguilla anguilla TaxID=7936 RepID=A0A0E9X2Y4_ANGAN